MHTRGITFPEKVNSVKTQHTAKQCYSVHIIYIYTHYVRLYTYIVSYYVTSVYAIYTTYVHT